MVVKSHDPLSFGSLKLLSSSFLLAIDFLEITLHSINLLASRSLSLSFPNPDSSGMTLIP